VLIAIKDGWSTCWRLLFGNCPDNALISYLIESAKATNCFNERSFGVPAEILGIRRFEFRADFPQELG
jgi:hypothetical protein